MVQRYVRPLGTDPMSILSWISAQQAQMIHTMSVGEVTAVDGAHWVAKVTILPEDIKTNWISIPSTYAGNGYGIWGLPEIGAQVLLGFEGADFGLPKILCYLSNRIDKPPQLKAGQLSISTKSGGTLLLDEQGQVTTSSAAGANVLLDSSGNVVFNAGTKTVAREGDTATGTVVVNDTSYPVTVTINKGSAKVLA